MAGWPNFAALPNSLVFISAGAICSATAYCLHDLAITAPAVSIFEPKFLDPPDLNRYITAFAADVGCHKADLMASWLSSLEPPASRPLTFSSDTGLSSFEQDAHFIVGVDDIPSRWEVAQRKLRSLLVVATEADLIRISRHDLGRDGACARCLDPEPSAINPNEIVPTISFVSALTGITIAAETLKSTSTSFVGFLLRNLVQGRVFQLAKYGNWRHSFHERQAGCICSRVA
jgi:molybdopterin/thiamine biosynthesis adenylyltransferase